MAFTSAIVGRSKLANKNVTYGTWDADGDGEGDINTGLTICEFISLTPHVANSVASCIEDLPCAGNAVTIDNEADSDGYWLAVGR